ncbi:MAG: hydratase [Pseudomonadota bacterium]
MTHARPLPPTSAHFDASACAAALLGIWRAGGQLPALPPELRPATLAEGYAAQDQLMAAAGEPRAGWKLGVGSPALLQASGLQRPLIGQVSQPRRHPGGATLLLPGAAPVTIECEIAFVLARDIPPDGPRRVGPDTVRHACVSFEVVRSRFVSRRTVGWPSFVADNVGFEALVVGDALPLDLLREVNRTVEVRLDGLPAASALSGDDATDPLASLQSLLDHAGERGVTLRAGEIVSTGAMCTPFDVQGAGHQLRATFAGRQLAFQL